MILLVEIYKQSKRVHKTLKQKSQTKLSSLSEKRSVLVARAGLEPATFGL